MKFLDILFPKKCLNCGLGDKYICEKCIAKVSILNQICPYCEKSSIDGFTHVVCRKKFRLEGVFSLWRYEGVIRTAILNLKYKFATQIACELSYLMVSRLKKFPFFSEKIILVPVPIYWLRENFRGFNQSQLIGKIVSKNLNWIFYSDILFRQKLRQPQTNLDKDERRENIKGVFLINKKYQEFIKDKKVVLFDDVYTTGSTLKEASKILKKGGAKVVFGLTIAR